jgi:hypothetical protein
MKKPPARELNKLLRAAWFLSEAIEVLQNIDSALLQDKEGEFLVISSEVTLTNAKLFDLYERTKDK